MLLATCAAGCATRDLWDWAAEDSLGPAVIEPLGVLEDEGLDRLVFSISGSADVEDGAWSLPIELTWRELPYEQIGEFEVGARWLSAARPPGANALAFDDLDREQRTPGSSAYAVEVILAERDTLVDVYGRRDDLKLWVRLRTIRVADDRASPLRPVAAALGTPFTWAFDLAAGSVALVLGGTLAGFGVTWADPMQYIGDDR